jgi:uncharacterized protein YcfL
MRNKLILLFLITFLIVGCGTRKTQQTKTDVTTKEVTTDNSVIETKTDTNTKVIDCTLTDEIEIIPIDNTKEIVVNGKTYKNVRLKSKKTKNNVTTNKVEKVSKKQQNAIKIKSKASIEVKQKETERNSNYWWLILLIPIYLLYRKYKHKFTNVG